MPGSQGSASSAPKASTSLKQDDAPGNRSVGSAPPEYQMAREEQSNNSEAFPPLAPHDSPRTGRSEPTATNNARAGPKVNEWSGKPCPRTECYSGCQEPLPLMSLFKKLAERGEETNRQFQHQQEERERQLQELRKEQEKWQRKRETEERKKHLLIQQRLQNPLPRSPGNIFSSPYTPFHTCRCSCCHPQDIPAEISHSEQQNARERNSHAYYSQRPGPSSSIPSSSSSSTITPANTNYSRWPRTAAHHQHSCPDTCRCGVNGSCCCHRNNNNNNNNQKTDGTDDTLVNSPEQDEGRRCQETGTKKIGSAAKEALSWLGKRWNGSQARKKFEELMGRQCPLPAELTEEQLNRICKGMDEEQAKEKREELLMGMGMGMGMDVNKRNRR